MSDAWSRKKQGRSKGNEPFNDKKDGEGGQKENERETLGSATHRLINESVGGDGDISGCCQARSGLPESELEACNLSQEGRNSGTSSRRCQDR